MYAVTGRSWIALGDPVGPGRVRVELAWQFSELCDLHNGWLVFYAVGQEHLPLYVDLGLTLLKLGEEARVRLTTCPPQGAAGAQLQQAFQRMEKAGGTFAIIPASDVAPLLPELRAVSNAWLAEKRTREKGFPLGRFDDQYLAQFPLAVVRHNGKIVAFANVWRGAEHAETAPDLIRYAPEWRPKYLASPGGLALPRILTDIATCIADGPTAMVTQ